MNNNDLIRRGDVKALVSDTWWNEIESVPAVDAVEVVRCRECENWTKQTNNPGPDGLGACSFHKANLVTGEGFCYWGQRREDGDA